MAAHTVGNGDVGAGHGRGYNTGFEPGRRSFLPSPETFAVGDTNLGQVAGERLRGPPTGARGYDAVRRVICSPVIRAAGSGATAWRAPLANRQAGACCPSDHEVTTKQPDDLLGRLRAGDEIAFASLVRRLTRSMTAVAIGFVRSRATADEVVQDTWVAVIEGLDAFEARSSLKNWIFAILANKARTRAVRDSRMIPVADFARDAGDDGEPPVDPSRFDAAGSWIDLPTAWDDLTPERIVAGKQTMVHVGEAIEQLPAAQRSVLILREIEKLEPREVGATLGITEGNQRVLLHRARARIRRHLEKAIG